MYNSIDAKSNDIKTNYHLLISGIVPRPIAFVGSRNSNGDENFGLYDSDAEAYIDFFGVPIPILSFFLPRSPLLRSF